MRLPYRSTAPSAVASVAAFAVLNAFTSRASAQTLDPAVPAAMHAYYRGEQREGFVFMAVGAAGIGGGTAFLFVESERARAFGGTLLGFGLIELVAGVAFSARANGQIATRDAMIARDPRGFVRAELARQRTITSQLTWLEVIEIAIAVGGTVTAYVGAATHNEIAVGLGTGLALEGATMLLFDHFEHLRADRFLHVLERHAPSLAVSPLSGGGFATLSLRF